MAEQSQIHELILTNFNNSLEFLCDFFDIETTDTADLIEFVKVLAALRGLPREAMDEVVLPILTAQFAAFGLDPTNPDDRESAAEMADLMALSIQDATQMIMQIMQQQQSNTSKIMTGHGHLLKR